MEPNAFQIKPDLSNILQAEKVKHLIQEVLQKELLSKKFNFNKFFILIWFFKNRQKLFNWERKEMDEINFRWHQSRFKRSCNIWKVQARRSSCDLWCEIWTRIQIHGAMSLGLRDRSSNHGFIFQRIDDVRRFRVWCLFILNLM